MTQIERKAWALIRAGVARLDRDILAAERELQQLREKRDGLRLIREKGLADLSAQEAADLSRALAQYEAVGNQP